VLGVIAFCHTRRTQESEPGGGVFAEAVNEAPNLVRTRTPKQRGGPGERDGG